MKKTRHVSTQRDRKIQKHFKSTEILMPLDLDLLLLISCWIFMICLSNLVGFFSNTLSVNFSLTQLSNTQTTIQIQNYLHTPSQFSAKLIRAINLGQTLDINQLKNVLLPGRQRFFAAGNGFFVFSATKSR